MVKIKEIGFDDRVRFKYKKDILEGVVKDIEFDDFGIELDDKKGYQNWVFVDIHDIIAITVHGNKKRYFRK